MAGPGYRFRLRTDLAANLPAASGGNAFAFFYATNTAEFSISDGATWLNLTTPPLNPALFISPTGSDAAAGTVGAPLATPAEALRRLARGYRGTATVTCAAGTYAALASADATWAVPAATGGPGGGPVTFVGPMADSGLGTLTATGGLAGTGVTFGNTTTGTVLGVNAWVGYLIRATGGSPSNIGVSRWIVSNTAGQINIDSTWPVVPANGDTFVIEKPAAIFPINTPSGGITFNVYAPTGVLFQGIEFQATGAGSFIDFTLNGGEWTFINCRFVANPAFFALSQVAGKTYVGAFPTALQQGASALPYAGAYASASVAIFSTFAGGDAVIQRTFYSGAQPNFNGPGRVNAFTENYLGGGSRMQSTGCSYFAASFCRVVAPSSDGFQLFNCPMFALASIDVSTSGGAGVNAGRVSRGTITALTGTGNTGTGLLVANNSQVRVTDPNTGTTIGTDVVRAVKVGNNAVDTWANINALTLTSTSDFAAASSGVAAAQYCSISK